MNNHDPPPESLTGAIPRKKLPPIQQQPAAPAAASAPPALDKIPRKAKPPPLEQPRMQQHASKPGRSILSGQHHRSQHRLSSHSRPSNASSSSSSLRAYNNATVQVMSESPLVLRIRGPAALALRKRIKRPRTNYEEPALTDPEDFLTDSEDEVPSRKRKKRAQDARSMTPTGSAGAAMASDATTALAIDGATALVPVLDPMAIDAPPPGVLATLWYSRECFLHVFCLEKICGWKTRPKVQLVDKTGEVHKLDPTLALKYKQSLLAARDVWAESVARMEVSRIVSTQCPVVLTLAAQQEAAEAQAKGESPAFTLSVSPEKEEVLLVKWRGRSHLHCSWERATDIQRLDPSNNTARNKIRRFYQAREQDYGVGWKTVLEERNVAAVANEGGEEDDGTETEEYFSRQCLEIERIMACDESEMNMGVLAKQRALNIRDEQEALKKKEAEGHSLESNKSDKIIGTAVQGLVDVNKKEDVWDPEDNVRYVIKWKGLPYAEMTWEYWRDIKTDAVDEAEDFWFRQTAPDPDELRRVLNMPHPHIRDFRKLQESAVYGMSTRARPVADLGGESASTSTEEDEADTVQGFKLRSYQLEGVNWLLFNWWNKRSCILADEMGLGKTIQSAAFLRELQTQSNTQVRAPFLIVAPLSLVGQWQSELHSWAPDMNVVLYHGSADARDFLVQQEFYFTDQFVPKATAIKLKKQHVTKFHVLITTYEVILKDLPVFSKIRWKALVVDEAHRLKNSKSRLFEMLISVPRDFCLLLTGTPIANATEELWALLHFANPKVFGDKEDFLEKFGEMTDAKQVNELHSLLKPYLLRRVKEDVEKSLPPKEETILEVALTPIQKTYYKAIYERNTSFLFKGSKPSNAPSLMNVMMELRKCCNHPFLVRGAEERILADAVAKLKEKDDQGNEVMIDHMKVFADNLVKSSGKMVLMEKLLQKLFVGGHKVLIFSQMVRALDILEELLKVKQYRYERLDGSTSSSARTHAVDRFVRKSCQRFVMLLSTRAGGLGLNLTAADIVIIFDSDFNPQNDLQAMARAHRIGQTRAVRVYRLLTAKTYEIHMFHAASMKLGLERAVLSQNRDQEEDSDGQKKKSDRELQAKEIDELLKKGAYDVFRDEDDTDAEKFMETDIDQLLESSSKQVTYGATSSSIGSGLGSFSKASFVANTDDGAKDVDLDDPDFWAKAVGLAAPEETPEEVAAMLDDGVKRSRKQVQVYDPYAETAEAEQRKKEKLAMEKMLEKEEKERAKLEKKKKKIEAKEKKKREKEGQDKSQQPSTAAKTSASTTPGDESAKKAVKEVKPKKSKKNERLRALRRAENEDPVLERLKQAWEPPQRNRASAAAIRFGFGRFCKIRNESNLTSLPLQDLEVFMRSYIFQLSLQVAATLLDRLQANPSTDDLRPMFQEWLGQQCDHELEWVSSSVRSVMKFQLEVESKRRFLRIPYVLTEPSYVDDLRRGAALRALRRVGLLERLNRFVEDCLDSILSGLGHEELGKRGCSFNDLSTLDPDLKNRYVTTEELALTIGSYLRKLDHKLPVAWWDRTCDVGLIIGSFIHGVGNYEAMRNDRDLPFAEKITRLSRRDQASVFAAKNLRVVAKAARQVFDDALDAARVKAELEVQAAVAAAAKAASKREEDAALLRKGGVEAEAVISNMPDTQVENAFAFDGTDSHFVTLPRMQQSLHETMQKEAASTWDAAGMVTSDDALPEPVKSEGDDESPDDEVGATGRVREHHQLPMPDARVLDHRLIQILKEIEKALDGENGSSAMECESNPDLWRKSSDVLTNLQVRAQAIPLFVADALDVRSEYSGVGIGGSQCGTSHRTLNDGSDFSYGSASAQLAQVAYGTDAPRFLRALGIPMNVTRFALTGLVYAEKSFVTELLTTERVRYYGKETGVGVDAASGAPIGPEPRLSEAGESKEIPSTTVSVKEENGAGPVAEPPVEAAPTVVTTRVDPVDLILEAFRENATLRAFVCIAVAFYGFPTRSATGETVSSDLWRGVHRESGAMETDEPPEVFNLTKFRDAVVALAADVEVPDEDTIYTYVETILLPHCLRLCINGNGPSTRNARGSHGEYETAFGVSIHPEPSRWHPSPIPDPCLSLQEHSLEALGLANAMLRRVRLLRSCLFLSKENNSEVSPASLLTVARSKFMGAVDGLPVWWCPWIHDIALLVTAASQGLFAVMRKRPDVLSVHTIQQSLYSAFLSNEKAWFGRSMESDDVSSWTERQAEQFPTLLQVERRLAFLCSQATAKVEHEARFDNLPMLDHGGWPRN